MKHRKRPSLPSLIDVVLRPGGRTAQRRGRTEVREAREARARHRRHSRWATVLNMLTAIDLGRLNGSLRSNDERSDFCMLVLRIGTPRSSNTDAEDGFHHYQLRLLRTFYGKTIVVLKEWQKLCNY